MPGKDVTVRQNFVQRTLSPVKKNLLSFGNEKSTQASPIQNIVCAFTISLRL
jgi:hypothetical protein